RLNRVESPEKEKLKALDL
ncbi:unnamed protein product, partial [Allacma fusca]